jgi:hypothetical protein
MLDFEAPNPGTCAAGGTVEDDEGVGEGAVLWSGEGAVLVRRGAAVVDIDEWTSLLDICFDREEIAHPARTPAAPVAELTRPACPVPFCAEVVVIGPIEAEDSGWTVSGYKSAGAIVLAPLKHLPCL